MRVEPDCSGAVCDGNYVINVLGVCGKRCHKAPERLAFPHMDVRRKAQARPWRGFNIRSGEGGMNFRWQDYKNLVGFGRPRQVRARRCRQTIGEFPGHRIGVTGIVDPMVTLEITYHLRAEQAALRHCVARALAAEGEGLGLLRIEENHGLAGKAAIFGGAERHNVDA